MIIQANQELNLNDLIGNLERQFPAYSVYEFGSLPLKSIILRKSATVGVQITVRHKEIIVDACFPNIVISSLMSLFTASTIFPFSSWFNFEMKISDYLRSRYI